MDIVRNIKIIKTNKVSLKMINIKKKDILISLCFSFKSLMTGFKVNYMRIKNSHMKIFNRKETLTEISLMDKDKRIGNGVGEIG